MLVIDSTLRRVVTNHISAVVLLFVAASALSGCSTWPPDPESDVPERVASEMLPTPSSSDDLGDIHVYVDRTLSMAPFLGPSSSPYRDVLNGLDNLFGGQASFFGFGFPNTSGEQTIKPISPGSLLSKGRYEYVNNDYASLFRDLDRDGTTHLIVSDGVQSTRDAGARFSEIIESIDTWIQKGGIFTVLSYRAPYQGTYYHEVPETGSIAYDCKNRPFHVFGFFPSSEALDRYVEIMQEDRLNPVYQVSVGPPGTRIQPLESPPANTGERRGPRALRDITEYYRDDASVGLYAATVASPSPPAQLPYSVLLSKNAPPWQTLSSTVRRDILSSLEASVRGYRLDGINRGDTLTVSALDDSVLNVQEADVSLQSDTSAVLTIPMRASLDPGRSYLALDVQVRLSPSGANRVVPSDLSTRVDSRVAACSQTLNLRRTLGAILREHYLVGRSVLLTEWPGASG